MKDRLLRILSIWMLVLFVTAAISGCNTIQGMGEDTEAAGEAIQDKAEDEDDD